MTRKNSTTIDHDAILAAVTKAVLAELSKPAKEAKPSKTVKAKPTAKPTTETTRSLCKVTRSEFITAAQADGVDLVGLSTKAIAEKCTVEGYTPSGFRIGERYTAMFAADVTPTKAVPAKKAAKATPAKASAKKATTAKVSPAKATKKATTVADVLRFESDALAAVAATVEVSSTTADVEGMTPEAIKAQGEWMRSKNLAPLGAAWTAVRKGERSIKALKALNVAEGFVTPTVLAEPKSKLDELVEGGFTKAEAEAIIASL